MMAYRRGETAVEVAPGTERIRVFGGVGVDVHGEPVSISGLRQSRLLALLAIRAGAFVSVDWLAEHLWSDEDRPVAAAPALRTYIFRLRQQLPEDARAWIQTETSGYRFTIPDEQLDHRRFANLREKARAARDNGDPQTANELLDEALNLWTGDPFRELEDLDWAMPEIEQLRLDRLEALEERWEANLALGRHTQITGELAAFTAEHGLRDRAAQQFALALHRSGRTAEALRVIDDHRRTLAEQSGLDPSPGILDLEKALLAGDPALEVEKVGRPLRGYRLLEEIGSGAFAVVWRGVQPSIDREVAIKQIRSDLASRPEFIRRFEAEAHLVARIEHPHIVPLIDFWRDPDSAYLVMRWLRGGTLERRLDDGPLNVEQTCTLAREMCGALAAAHQHGIIHRDVKSANILFDEADHAYLGDFGIALEAESSAGPEASLSTGSPAYSSPEQLRRERLGPEADVFSLGVVLFECLTGSLPFHDSRSVSELIDLQLNTEYPRLIELRSDVPAAISNAIAKATSKNAADRFATMAEFLEALDAHDEGSGPEQSVVAASAIAPNPYKGLRAFDAGDAAEFFGRKSLTNRLVERLSGDTVRSRCVIAVGPSGSGKSSVVRAGLLPAVRAGAVPGSQDWFSTTMVPGANPFESLEAALLRISVNPPASLLTLLTDGKRGILRGVRRCLASDDDIALLIIDQFEEVFTSSSTNVAHEFLEALAIAVEDPTSPLRLVITLRADYYDRPLAHPAFARILDQAAVNVRPLAPDELEMAMVEPARLVGVEFEPGLVARIAADTVSQPAPLPLLQYTLAELFDRRHGNRLTIATYDDIGGVVGALAARAEAIHTAAGETQRDTMRRIFGRMVNPDNQLADLRRRVKLADLGHSADVTWTLERLGEARLVTFDRDGTSREPTVEVAHEALLREWPRLAGWLDEDAELLRSMEVIRGAARTWDEGGRLSADLYRGDRLDSSVDLALSAPDRLRPIEEEFITASRIASDVERQTEKRRVRRLRRLLAGVGAALVVALIAGSLALREQQRADEEANRAQLASAEAVEQADIAVKQTETAVAATERAELATLISRSAATSSDDPELSILLALEAHRRFPTAETEQAVLSALGSSAIPNQIVSRPLLDSPAAGCADDAPTSRLSTNLDGTAEFGVANGQLVSRDPSTGSVVEHGAPPAECIVWMADEALDRRWAGSIDGLRMWFGPYDGPWQVEKRFRAPTTVLSRAFTSSGKLVAVAESGGFFVTLLDDQTGELVGTSLDARNVLGRIEVSPNGRFIAAGIAKPGDVAVSEPRSVVLDGMTGEELFRFDSSSSLKSSVYTFDEAAGELIVGNQDGTILTVDLTTQEVISEVRTNARSGFVSLGVRSDGLIMATTTGEIELVDRHVGSTRINASVRNVVDARVRSDDSVLVVTSDRVAVLDLDGTALVQRVIDVDPLADVDVNAGRAGVVRNPNGVPALIDLESGERTILDLVNAEGLRYDPLSIWPMADGFWAIGADNSLTRWDGNTMIERIALNGAPRFWVPAFDSHALLTQTPNGVVAQLISANRGQFELEFSLRAPNARAVHPTSEGGLLLLDGDGTLRTFDSTETEIGSISVRAGIGEANALDISTVTSNAVDPTSGKLAIGSSAGVTIVDPVTGEVAGLPGSGSVASLRFARNGELLAVTAVDGTVRLWDVERLAPAGLVWKGTGIDGGGSWYDEKSDSLWVNTSGKVLQVPLDPQHWVERACEVVGREMTLNEWTQFVPGDSSLESSCS